MRIQPKYSAAVAAHRREHACGVEKTGVANRNGRSVFLDKISVDPNKALRHPRGLYRSHGRQSVVGAH
jgi:hypothetical protein